MLNHFMKRPFSENVIKIRGHSKINRSQNGIFWNPHSSMSYFVFLLSNSPRFIQGKLTNYNMKENLGFFKYGCWSSFNPFAHSLLHMDTEVLISHVEKMLKFNIVNTVALSDTMEASWMCFYCCSRHY